MHYLEPEKEIARQALVYRLADIADEGRQKKMWYVEKNTQTVMRIISDFFHTCQKYGFFENPQDFRIANEEYVLLKKFAEVLQKYAVHNGNKDPEHIFNATLWHQICRLAQHLVERLRS